VIYVGKKGKRYSPRGIPGTHTMIPQGAAWIRPMSLEFPEASYRYLAMQECVSISGHPISQEMTGIELTPAALRHTLLRVCEIIIVGRPDTLGELARSSTRAVQCVWEG